MACAVLALYGKSLSIYCKSRSIASLSIASQHKRHCLLLFCRAYLWGPFVSLPMVLFSLGHFSITFSLVGLLALVCFFCGTCLVIVFGGQFQTNHHRLCFLLVSSIEGAKVAILSQWSKLFCILFSIIDSLPSFSRSCIVISFSTNTIREPAPWEEIDWTFWDVFLRLAVMSSCHYVIMSSCR